jgi:hypothetical protein
VACFSSLECVGGELYLTREIDAGCLTALERVGAGLGVRDASVATLEGLRSLGSVGGSLEIWGTTALSELAGLEALRHVGGSLSIDDNAALTDIDALLGLTRVGASFIVTENPLLPTCAAENLSALPVVRGSTTISENGPCEP